MLCDTKVFPYFIIISVISWDTKVFPYFIITSLMLPKIYILLLLQLFIYAPTITL